MNPIPPTPPIPALSQATANALAVNLFGLPAVLAFFILLLAALLSTGRPSSGGTAVMMVLSAAGPTLWLACGQLRRASAGPLHHLLGRQVWSWVLALRVPLAVFGAGRLAGRLDRDPACFWVGGAVAGIWGPALLRWLVASSSYPTKLLRGTQLLSPAQVRQAAATLSRAEPEPLDWCGVNLPDALASGHFSIVGATASGKTLSMRLLMQSVLSGLRPGGDRRALIYDAKQDALAILSGMKLRVPVVVLNPFDARSAAWDMARDIAMPATALQAAHTLIPEESNGGNVFFVKAARDLLAAVFVALHLTKPGQWTLAEVVLILSDTRRTALLLDSLPQTRAIAREYFDRDPRTLANVQSTISAHMAMLRPVAAMWSRCPYKISLAQWSQEDSILVLGNDETMRGPMDAINRVLFQRMTELVLAQSESGGRRSWFFLDEAKELGKLDSLPRLMTKGRSKGARVVLAWQTIEGLRSVYGEQLGDELAGMCANKAFLRTDSPVTAQWAAKVLGEQELREWTRSVQRGLGSSPSRSEHIVKREAVLAAQIMQLPPADRQRFLGYFVTPGIGVYQDEVRFAGRLWPLGQVANFIGRPPEHQYLSDEGDGGCVSDDTSVEEDGEDGLDVESSLN